MSTAGQRGTFEGLKRDLVAVLDEHGAEYLSLTFTDSKKRTHGSLNFETVLEGDKQERLPMGKADE